MAEDAEAVEIAGKKLTCPVCSGKHFHHLRDGMHGIGDPLFMVPSSVCAAKWGNVQWFVGVGEEE